MPKLPAVVEKLDAMPEAVREYYIQEGERFVLDLEAVDGHPLTVGGKKALDRERRGRESAEGELRNWKALGVNPEDVAELKRRAEGQPGNQDPDAVQRKIDKAVKEALAGVQPKLERLEAVEAENRKLKVTDTVRAAFIAAGGLEEDADDAVRLTEARFKLNDAGKVVVIDDEGDESTVGLKDWFAREYRKQKPKFFRGTDASGSGAREATGSGGDGVVTLTPEQASDKRTYDDALAKVKGDHSKVVVKTG